MNIEYAVLDFIRDTFSSEFLDAVMRFFTFLGDAGWIWILTGVTLLFFKSTRRIGGSVLLALVFSFVFSNLMLKPLIARTRPFDLIEGIKLIIDAPTDFSFPSGHTSASFAAASAIFFQNKKYGAVAIVLSCIIAFSRLYLYVHFPSDVIGGCVIGWICGFGSYLTLKHIKK
jgi:undecaprenyl-diphosphatase